MLFVALWLWLDKPWLWALFEALALTYGLWVCGARGCRRGGRGELPAKDEPLNPSEQPLPPPLGERGRRQKKPNEKGAEDTDRAQGETAAAGVPARPRPRVRAFGRPLPSPLGGRPPGSP